MIEQVAIRVALNTKPILSHSEASKFLDIDEQTLWLWCRKGYVNWHSPNGTKQRYYRRQDLEKLMFPISQEKIENEADEFLFKHRNDL